MGQDINKKLEDILQGIDKNKINNSKRSLEQMLNTPEGKKLLQNIGNIDKSKLMNMFMKMDTNEIKRKLQNADLSKMSNINANDIIGEKRVFFENLCNELLVLAKAMNVKVRSDFLKEYYANFEKYKERDDANVYSSILNDMNIGQPSEIDFLFFIVIELAKEYKVDMPYYFKVAEKFKQYNSLNKFLS